MRFTALTVAGGLAVATLAITATTPAHADTANQSTKAAVSWLTKQQNANGLIASGAVEDVSSSLYMGLGLARTGAAPAALDALRASLESKVAGWATDKTGRIAQVSAFYTAVSDTGARDVAGTDYIAKLEAQIDDTTGQLGAFSDMFGQSWAVEALFKSNSPEKRKATEFLIGEQCENAGWGYTTGSDCVSGVDETALAITALAQQPGNAAARAAVTTGTAWLVEQMAIDGSLGKSDWTDYNTNSTGLAAWAMAKGGAPAAAAKAANWVRAHQVGLACDQALATQTGAISYTDATLADDLPEGWVNAASTISATAQAFPALTLTTGGAAVSVTSPAFVPAGASVAVKVTGLGAGERACLPGTTAAVVGTGAPVSLSLPLGSGTFTVATLAGTASAKTVALAATKLTVKAPKKVKRGAKTTVKISKLTRGENVTVKLAGKKVASGVASAQGTFTATVKVAKKYKKGKKLSLTVQGHYANRSGSTKIVVK